ncbi:MAG TPA: glycosyltransferase family 4 protein [Planctomycetota bacterium]|nr:glycosyltransferase family 4 protein [Planctomycetota bacterium]
MRLLMVSGDRQVAIGERGPLFAMQREFSRHFERIDVLCPRPAGPVVVREIHGNVFLHPAACGRAGMVGYIEREGARLLAEHGHALITSHDYGWFYNGIGSAALSRKSGVPYLSEIHHVPGHPVAAGLRERFDRLVAKRYVRWARSRAAAFRVVNAGEAKPLLASWGVPQGKILVLPSLYMDLTVFRPAEVAPEPEQDVVFVGRMVANKGLDRIVDALALCAARGNRLRALFVGKGPLAERTRRRAMARGLERDVRFVDWVASPAELAEVYRKSRAIVCASTCEGGPRVTVEAMACGTPAVSTPVGMMRELLRQGVNGALCGFDAASLAGGLERVLGDEAARRRMGEQARRDVQRFEHAAAIRVYAEGLKRLAGEPIP